MKVLNSHVTNVSLQLLDLFIWKYTKKLNMKVLDTLVTNASMRLHSPTH